MPDQQQMTDRAVRSKRANRFQSRWRAVGGRLHVADGQLRFDGHRIDHALGGRDWSTPLTDISDVRVEGRRKLVEVELRDGTVERFVVRPAEAAAEELGNLARSANGA